MKKRKVLKFNNWIKVDRMLLQTPTWMQICNPTKISKLNIKWKLSKVNRTCSKKWISLNLQRMLSKYKRKRHSTQLPKQITQLPNRDLEVQPLKQLKCKMFRSKDMQNLRRWLICQINNSMLLKDKETQIWPNKRENLKRYKDKNHQVTLKISQHISCKDFKLLKNRFLFKKKLSIKKEIWERLSLNFWKHKTKL